MFSNKASWKKTVNYGCFNTPSACCGVVYLAWTVALVATAGSLFFSEVMELPPCVLCWYQRIAMYPLVLIIGSAIITGDRGWRRYAVPLIVIGLSVAVYHNLLYYNLIEESLAPCTQGISCTSRQIEWLGFITIPLLSLTAFAALLVLSVLPTAKTKASKG